MATNNNNNTETYLGRIKWFNSKKGYGFITNCTTSEDIFVHHSGITVTSDCWKALFPGEYVQYELETTDVKTQAVNIRGVEGGPLLCETRNEINKQRRDHQHKDSGHDEQEQS